VFYFAIISLKNKVYREPWLVKKFSIKIVFLKSHKIHSK